MSCFLNQDMCWSLMMSRVSFQTRQFVGVNDVILLSFFENGFRRGDEKGAIL